MRHDRSQRRGRATDRGGPERRQVAWLVTLLGLLVSGLAAAEPYTPRSDSEVLERLPRGLSGGEARRARQQRERLAGAPRNLPLAIRVAREHVARGRREADPRYMGYAEAILRPWFDDPQIPPQVLLLRAIIRQNRHAFSDALADLEALLAREPRNLQAWLVRSSIETVRGDYAAAERSCAPLQRVRPRLLFATCVANAASLQGRAESSYRALRSALGSGGPADADVRVWSTTLLAEIAERLGRDERARAHYRSALEIDPEDSYLLTVHADFLLRTGAPDRVVRLLEGREAVDGLLLRLALAYRASGDAGREAGAVESLQSRFDAARQRGSSVHLREEAMLALHLQGDAVRASALALQNWQQQREAIDLAVLLEAARAAGDRDAERIGREWVARHDLEDARLGELLAR